MIALVGSEISYGDVQEQAVIGLTAESEWPFHDVHLSTAAARLGDPTLVTTIQAELGLDADADAVSLDRERRPGEGVLVVTARAGSGDDAASLANAVAEEMATGPDLPLTLVDPADGNAEVVGRASAVGAGALVGLLVGLVAAPLRRSSRG